MFSRFSRGIKKFWATAALLSAEMLVIIAVFFISLTSFVYLIRRIFLQKNEKLDTRVFDSIKPYINDTNTSIMNFVTFFGKHEFLIPANLVLIGYFLARKRTWYSIKIPAVAISSLLLMFGLKHLFSRQRPSDQLLQEATNFSFPSGHALMSVTFYGLMAYVLWRNIKNKPLRWAVVILIVAWIHLIGFSRIYLRKHYFSDVIAGYAVGFLWLVFAVWALNKMEKYSQTRLNKVVNQPAQNPA